MKSKFNAFISATIVFLLISCGGTQEFVGSVNQYNITLNNNGDSIISFDGIFEDFTIIPLDNKKDALLSRVSRMFVVDKNFYLFDGSSLPNIVMFDNSGRYICNVGTSGHAKGEYISLRDVCVCNDGTTYALSWDNSVIVYDKKGKYVKTITLPSETQYYRIVNCGNYFALSSRHEEAGSDYILSFFDKSFNLIGEKVENLKQKFEISNFVFNPLLSNNDKISYFDFYRNQFVISGIDSVYNSDVYSLVTKKTLSENEFVSGLFEKYPDVLTDVYLSDDRLFGFATLDEMLQYFDCDINNKKASAFIYSDLIPLIFYYSDGYYYAVFSADKLCQYQKNNHKNGFKNPFCDALDSLSDKIDPMDNFYIVKMKHRKEFAPHNCFKR